MGRAAGARVLATAVAAAAAATIAVGGWLAAGNPGITPNAGQPSAGQPNVGQPSAGQPNAGQYSLALDPVRIYPDIRILRSGSGLPAGVLNPAQIRRAYNVGPLFARGIDGAGQTIVLVDSFGSPTIVSDLATFDRHYGLPAPPSFRVIQPAGQVSAFRANPNRASWASETTLDVEWAHVMAPAARLVLVETPTSENEGTSGFPQIVAAETYVIRHHVGEVISQSFAATEQTFASRESVVRFRSVYQLAKADHVTVLSATGDEGATAYTFSMNALYTTRAVSWPATDPLVTAVGGTQLDLKPSGARRKPDVAWSGSGGGLSLLFTRPSYQDQVRSVTGDQRGVPDISMDASCKSGVAVYASFPTGGGWSGICGTSLATPLLAGLVALADQVAGHPLGLLNPALYAMEAAHARGIVDVVTGSNTATFTQGGKQYTVIGFSAAKGYDLVCGIGTVNAAYFVPELAKRAG
jgi:subtilase family serine protease